jgi:hypothetical protein
MYSTAESISTAGLGRGGLGGYLNSSSGPNGSCDFSMLSHRIEWASLKHSPHGQYSSLPLPAASIDTGALASSVATNLLNPSEVAIGSARIPN